MSRNLSLIAATAALAGLSLPGTAIAATSSSTTDVTGTAGAELSLSVGTPSAMTLTHATPATAVSAVTVTSTSPSWTLSISDQDAIGSGTAGRMDEVDCVTGALLGGSLANALEWSSNGTTFSALSATPATVATGSLVGAATVTYRQALGASEDVAVGDCYKLTSTYTVADA